MEFCRKQILLTFPTVSDDKFEYFIKAVTTKCSPLFFKNVFQIANNLEVTFYDHMNPPLQNNSLLILGE